jgi:hypothetical protein
MYTVNHLENVRNGLMTLEDLRKLNDFVDMVTRNNKNDSAYETLNFYCKEKWEERDPWKYRINKYGFRDDDWNFKKSPAFFGCSFTFGIGVKEPFPYIVQSLMRENGHPDIVVPNLGMPGSSAISIIKSFCAFSNLHPISNAFIILPDISRFPIFNYHEITDTWTVTNIIPGGDQKSGIKQLKHLIKFFISGQGVMHLGDYIDLAEFTAKEKNIKLYWSTWLGNYNKLVDMVGKNYIDWTYQGPNGRDDMHPGILTHQIMAEKFFKVIKKDSE